MKFDFSLLLLWTADSLPMWNLLTYSIFRATKPSLDWSAWKEKIALSGFCRDWTCDLQLRMYWCSTHQLSWSPSVGWGAGCPSRCSTRPHHVLIDCRPSCCWCAGFYTCPVILGYTRQLILTYWIILENHALVYWNILKHVLIYYNTRPTCTDNVCTVF